MTDHLVDSDSSLAPSPNPAASEAASGEVSNVSGGVAVTGERVEVGNDVVGRDKIVQATTYIEHATIIQSVSPLPGEDQRGRVVKIEPALNGGEEAAHALPADTVPEVYIHTFDALPNIPAGAALIDWSKHFSRAVTPRQVPTPTAWQTELLPELERLRDSLGRRELIRVHTTAALSAGFAFGHAFTARGRYHLEVVQRSGDRDEHWRSDAALPAGVHAPEFRRKELVGDPARPEALVVIYASKTQPLDKVLGDVGQCWGDTEALQRLSGEDHLEYNIPAIFDLLQEGFSNEDLRTLAFKVPALKPVYNNLAASMTTSEIARQIVEYADKHLMLEPVLSAIQQQNPRRYRQAESRLRLPGRSGIFQRVLLLETEIASKDQRFITGWEAAELARSAQQQMARLVSALRRPVHIKLCLTVPFGLAVFLGHHWNAIGQKVQVYEYIGGATPYAPACEVDV